MQTVTNFEEAEFFFKEEIMRIIALVCTLAVLLTGCGMPTRSSRTKITQDVPMSTWYVPLGNQVPPDVAAMQGTTTTVAPSFAQPYISQHSPVSGNVMQLSKTVEHEESSVLDASAAFLNTAFGTWIIANGVRRFIPYSHPHGHRFWR